MKYKLVDTEQLFVDATHVKACANSKKMRKRIAREQTLWYEEELNKEIEKDRIAHDKKPLKIRNLQNLLSLEMEILIVNRIKMLFLEM